MRETIKIANLATYPARKDSLRKAVVSILPQVDILNVYLNDYEKIPDFLDNPNIKCVLGKDVDGNLKDNGKFYFLDKVPKDSYYFTIDDDIIYPENYVDRLISELTKYEKEVVVGVHGAILHQKMTNFFLDRIIFHFAVDLNKSLFVNMLGTGTLVFNMRVFEKMSITDFKTRGMADIWFAVFCRNQSIPMLCLERKDNWLKEVDRIRSGDDTLYNVYKEDYSEQLSIVNQYNLNSLEEDHFLQYILVLEELYRRDHENDSGDGWSNQADVVKRSKSYRLGDLFFRSVKKPYKLVTYPYNFIMILVGK